MLKVSKVLLLISGFFLIIDGIFIIAGLPNIINPEWPLPCPLVIIMLGLGIVLFILSGGQNKHVADSEKRSV